jgi:hypothetical protein
MKLSYAGFCFIVVDNLDGKITPENERARFGEDYCLKPSGAVD